MLGSILLTSILSFPPQGAPQLAGLSEFFPDQNDAAAFTEIWVEASVVTGIGPNQIAPAFVKGKNPRGASGATGCAPVDTPSGPKRQVQLWMDEIKADIQPDSSGYSALLTVEGRAAVLATLVHEFEHVCRLAAGVGCSENMHEDDCEDLAVSKKAHEALSDRVDARRHRGGHEYSKGF